VGGQSRAIFGSTGGTFASSGDLAGQGRLMKENLNIHANLNI
jgi:hypothetical protein